MIDPDTIAEQAKVLLDGLHSGRHGGGALLQDGNIGMMYIAQAISELAESITTAALLSNGYHPSEEKEGVE